MGYGKLPDPTTPKQRRAANSVDRVRAWRQAARVLDCEPPDAKTMRARTRREKDTAKWLRHYFPQAFYLPFGDVHHEIIEAAEYTIDTGGKCSVAAPRGTGKSTILAGVALKAMVQARVMFPVVIPWKDGDLKRALEFWKKSLCFNLEFAADYPEFCAPFVASRGNAMGIKRFTDHDGEPLGAQLVVSQKLIVLPQNRGVIGGATINGNPLGLNHATDDGRVLRPDLILIDDPQDRDTAMSEQQVSGVIQMIDYDISGMSGPDRPMPMMMACTVKQPEDVAQHYLNHPEWRAVRVGQIVTWPDGWEEKDSKSKAAWDDWNQARLDCGANQDKTEKAARAYYREHKELMTAGCAVSWKQRYRRKTTEDGPADPDAIYSALRDYYVMGHGAFMAERQNQPVDPYAESEQYKITPALISGRVDAGRSPGDVPEWAKVYIASSDVNHYGIHTVTLGMSNQQTTAVCWYRCMDSLTVPKNAPEQERRRIIFEMLVQAMKELVALPRVPSLWMIDGGYEHETVQRFATQYSNKCGMRIAVARGYSADRYRPTGRNVIGTAMEQCHMTEWPLGRGLAWNADYWREIAQRAWLGSVGAPGSCSLPEGHHAVFAEQICRERLAEKLSGKTGYVWKWKSQPGRHDYGDAMAQGYATAAYEGVGTGTANAVQPQRKRVSVRHVRI